MKLYSTSKKAILEVGDFIILFSHKTPVAYYSKKDDMLYVTDRKVSPTTTKHINAFCGDHENLPIAHYDIETCLEGK